jgi:hypothetical protein
MISQDDTITQTSKHLAILIARDKTGTDSDKSDTELPDLCNNDKGKLT